MSGDVAQLSLPPNVHLKLQMLRWLSECPRSYAETMEAWRTSCPRLSVWEDAVAEDLVQITATATRGQSASRVQLTAKGRALLRAAAGCDSRI